MCSYAPLEIETAWIEIEWTATETTAKSSEKIAIAVIYEISGIRAMHGIHEIHEIHGIHETHETHEIRGIHEMQESHGRLVIHGKYEIHGMHVIRETHAIHGIHEICGNHATHVSSGITVMAAIIEIHVIETAKMFDRCGKFQKNFPVS